MALKAIIMATRSERRAALFSPSAGAQAQPLGNPDALPLFPFNPEKFAIPHDNAASYRIVPGSWLANRYMPPHSRTLGAWRRAGLKPKVIARHVAEGRMERIE